MSKDACTQFFSMILESRILRQRWKAVTSLQEIMMIGRRHGYEFGVQDIIDVSCSLGDKAEGILRWDFGRKLIPNGPAASCFYHHEFNVDDIPGFEPVAAELNALKIQPSTVNIDRFRAAFRQEDFDFASLSPNLPDFPRLFQEICNSPPGEPGYGGRENHVINVDYHVDHPGFGAYFDAKCRIIDALEAFFGVEIRFSASLWYPPKSYRTWHTNDNQPGWRMYIVDFDEDPQQSGGQSFFRYMNPHTKDIVTLCERPRIVRFFKIEQEKDKLFWHCIVNGSTVHRWSFGFFVPDDWMRKLPER